MTTSRVPIMSTVTQYLLFFFCQFSFLSTSLKFNMTCYTTLVPKKPADLMINASVVVSLSREKFLKWVQTRCSFKVWPRTKRLEPNLTKKTKKKQTVKQQKLCSLMARIQHLLLKTHGVFFFPHDPKSIRFSFINKLVQARQLASCCGEKTNKQVQPFLFSG